MIETKQTDNLAQLKRNARIMSKKVTKPLPDRLERVLFQLDGDSLLQSLSSTEGLSSFHPFMAGDYPLPASSIAENNQIERSKGSGNSLGRSLNSSTDSASIKSGLNRVVGGDQISFKTDSLHHVSINEHHSVLNQQFTQLVNELSLGASNKGPSSSGLIKGASQAERTKKAQFSTRSLVEGGEFSVGAPSSLKQVTSEDSQVYPFFQQLESLVKSIEPTLGAQQKVSSSTENTGTTGSENQQLLNAQLRSDSSQAINEDGRQHPEDLVGNVEATKASHSLADLTDAFLSSNKQHISQAIGSQSPANQNTAAEDKGLSEHEALNGLDHSVPDTLKRNANVAMFESITASNVPSQANSLYSLDHMSPLATQKISDALNEYLQDQAGIHGVDL